MNPATNLPARGLSAFSRHTLARRLAAASFIAFSVLAASEARAAVITGVESSDGAYVNGSTIIGVSDTTFGAAWTAFGGGHATASNAEPKTGSLALRINSPDASASGALIGIPNAASLLSSPFTFQFSVNIQSITTNTGNQVQIYLGNNNQPGNGNHWVSISYADTAMIFRTGSGANDTSVSLGSWTSFSPLGSYVDFSITIDPTTKKFTNVSISGTVSGTSDVTSTILASNGGTVPWDSVAGIAPGAFVNLIVGSNDVGVIDFDNIGIAAIPEPSAFAALASLGVLGIVVLRRRHR